MNSLEFCLSNLWLGCTVSFQIIPSLMSSPSSWRIALLMPQFTQVNKSYYEFPWVLFIKFTTRMHCVFADHSIPYELSFYTEPIYDATLIHIGELVIQWISMSLLIKFITMLHCVCRSFCLWCVFVAHGGYLCCCHNSLHRWNSHTMSCHEFFLLNLW